MYVILGRKAFETFHLAANAAKQAKDNFRVASLYTDAGHCAKKYSLKGIYTACVK
jgi:hypothetical protein